VRKSGVAREIVKGLLCVRELLREGAVEVGRFERGTVRIVLTRRHEAVKSAMSVAVAALSTVVRASMLRERGRCEGPVLVAVS
jgi:hypothetical protein